jgi:hypothetical protein
MEENPLALWNSLKERLGKMLVRCYGGCVAIYLIMGSLT